MSTANHAVENVDDAAIPEEVPDSESMPEDEGKAHEEKQWCGAVTCPSAFLLAGQLACSQHHASAAALCRAVHRHCCVLTMYRRSVVRPIGRLASTMQS